MVAGISGSDVVATPSQRANHRKSGHAAASPIMNVTPVSTPLYTPER
jgi:hypothetical protein